MCACTCETVWAQLCDLCVRELNRPAHSEESNTEHQQTAAAARKDRLLDILQLIVLFPALYYRQTANVAY